MCYLKVIKMMFLNNNVSFQFPSLFNKMEDQYILHKDNTGPTKPMKCLLFPKCHKWKYKCACVLTHKPVQQH